MSTTGEVLPAGSEFFRRQDNTKNCLRAGCPWALAQLNFWHGNQQPDSCLARRETLIALCHDKRNLARTRQDESTNWQVAFAFAFASVSP